MAIQVKTYFSNTSIPVFLYYITILLTFWRLYWCYPKLINQIRRVLNMFPKISNSCNSFSIYCCCCCGCYWIGGSGWPGNNITWSFCNLIHLGAYFIFCKCFIVLQNTTLIDQSLFIVRYIQFILNDSLQLSNCVVGINLEWGNLIIHCFYLQSDFGFHFIFN